MKVGLFSPYGALDRQGGVLFVMANYLGKMGAEVTVLRCDGALLACRRDARAREQRRTLTSCTACAREQSALAAWGSVRMVQLSSLITAEDVVQGRIWIEDVAASDLSRLEFKGESLWRACSDDLRGKFPQLDPDRLGEEEMSYLRELYAAYIQVTVASERFLASLEPEISLVATAEDTLSQAFLSQASRRDGDVAVFSYDRSDDAVAVESLRGGSRYTTKVLLDDVTALRTDPRVWGPEVSALAHDILTVLGYGPTAVPSNP